MGFISDEEANGYRLSCCELNAKVKQLQSDLDKAKTYTGLEGHSCPLCEYKDGVFIKHCTMHEQIEQLQTEIFRYNSELSDALTKAEQLKAELAKLRSFIISGISNTENAGYVFTNSPYNFLKAAKGE